MSYTEVGRQFSGFELINALYDFSCGLTIICRQTLRRRFLLMLPPTECGENAGSYSPGLTGRQDPGYAASDPDPAMGLTGESHRARRTSTLPLLLGAPEGSCLS